jgi:excisionase family DNA binding protein
LLSLVVFAILGSVPTASSDPRPSQTRSHTSGSGKRHPRSRASAPGANGSLLFAEDVAALTGMTKDWIYAETRAGRIPYIALGRYYRYRRESIEAWLGELEHATVTLPRKAASRR